jgi:bifunctional non-homologous end joining protein LigD
MSRKTSHPHRRSADLKVEGDHLVRGQRRRDRDPAQPELPFDPIPFRIEPCLALLTAKPPEGPEWAYEIKWDGYRLAVHLEPGGKVRVLTRGGHDWTARFPDIAADMRALGPATMILDGEAVVLDDQGRSDFNALQKSLGGRGGKLASDRAVLYAFDVLYLDGHDLTSMELEDRRLLLDPLLEARDGAIRLSEMIQGDGAALFQKACEHVLEGIIAKRLDAPYKPGRGGEWRKIKCVQSDTFVIVGYEPSTAVPGAIASLLLAARTGGGLSYVGSVGTGFKQREARELKERLDTMRRTKAAVPLKGKSLVFVEPVLAAEIEYRAWTDDSKLRHASFKGLREPEDNADIHSLE